MVDPLQRVLLLLGRSMERNAYVRLAKIGRKEDFRDGGAADTGVGQLVTNQLFQLFTQAFGDAFVPMGVHAFRIQYVRENGGAFACDVGIV